MLILTLIIVVNNNNNPFFHEFLQKSKIFQNPKLQILPKSLVSILLMRPAFRPAFSPFSSLRISCNSNPCPFKSEIQILFLIQNSFSNTPPCFVGVLLVIIFIRSICQLTLTDEEPPPFTQDRRGGGGQPYYAPHCICRRSSTPIYKL